MYKAARSPAQLAIHQYADLMGGPLPPCMRGFHLVKVQRLRFEVQSQLQCKSKCDLSVHMLQQFVNLRIYYIRSFEQALVKSLCTWPNLLCSQ